MERPIMGKCHNRLWLVVLASFLLWFVLLCFYYSAPMVGDTFFNSVNFGVSNSTPFPGNSNESLAKNLYNPFTNFSAPDYGLQNFDHIVTQVNPINQTHLAENEVDESIDGEKPDHEVGIIRRGLNQMIQFPKWRREMRKSPKIRVRADTFMSMIFLGGSTKT
ncbi:hypothetical protein SLA2020_428600 [Shorea laevis]